MKHLLHHCFAACCAATVCLAPASRAADQEQAKAAIAKGGETYAKAFAAADAKALAAAYAADAEYKSLDGRIIRGREAIEAFFRGFFSDGRKRQLLVESESLTFPAPGVAVERGVTAVSEDGNKLAAQARFTNLLVEKDGQWLLASVEETPYAGDDRSSELAPLAPLIGQWEADLGEGSSLYVGVERAEGGNFVLIERVVTANSLPVSTSLEWVGWDPVGKLIRSWSFESDGSFSQSEWKADGTALVLATKATLREGAVVEETQRISRGPDGALSVEGVSLTLDGEKQQPAPALKFKPLK